MLRWVVLATFAACAPTVHAVKLVNRTERPIEAVYIYPTGSADRGKPRAAIAPNATATVEVRAGNVDVLAVSAKVRLDDRTSERRTATQTVQLDRALELIFHDSNQVPPGLGGPDTIGVVFRVVPEE